VNKLNSNFELSRIHIKHPVSGITYLSRGKNVDGEYRYLNCRYGTISDHQQSWGDKDVPWKGPGPPPLVAADFLKFFLISVLLGLLVLMTT